MSPPFLRFPSTLQPSPPSAVHANSLPPPRPARGDVILLAKKKKNTQKPPSILCAALCTTPAIVRECFTALNVTLRVRSCQPQSLPLPPPSTKRFIQGFQSPAPGKTEKEAGGCDGHILYNDTKRSRQGCLIYIFWGGVR